MEGCVCVYFVVDRKGGRKGCVIVSRTGMKGARARSLLCGTLENVVGGDASMVVCRCQASRRTCANATERSNKLCECVIFVEASKQEETGKKFQER
jgi:hypothetical protein